MKCGEDSHFSLSSGFRKEAYILKDYLAHSEEDWHEEK